MGGLVALALWVIVGVILIARLNLQTVPIAPADPAPFRFDGGYLLGVSDADMVATAYADGVLKQMPGLRDALTLVTLPASAGRLEKREVMVSNSVTSWPQVVAPSPDGRLVYVVETSGEAEDSVERLPSVDAFPPGRLLTVVETATAQVVRRVEVGENPISLAVSPDGRSIAVGLTEQGRRLAILPAATLEDPDTFRHFPIEQTRQEVSSVAWHPSNRFLAVTVDTREVQFYALIQTGGQLDLRPHGQPVAAGNTVTEGQFTPDGRHYVTAEVNWNTLPAPLSTLLNPPGQLIVTRFDASAAAQHRETARVNVQQSPEGIAVSPDGTLVVTVDMRRTYLPDGLAWWPGGEASALTLVRLDPQTGRARVVGSYGFEGILPEDAVFDADSDALAVTVYHYRENQPRTGALEFWRVVRDPEPRLVRTTTRLETVRGLHSLALIPTHPTHP